MPNIIGTWIPYARQALFDATPLRSIGSNDFATLDIRPGGAGSAKRKSLFGSTQSLTWVKPVDDVDTYFIYIDDGFITLVGRVVGDTLSALIHAEVKGLDGSGIYFKRAS